MKKSSLKQDKVQLNEIFIEFDKALENWDYEAIEINLKKALTIKIIELDDVSRAQLYYSIGTAYGDLLRVKNKLLSDIEKENNHENQLYYLRLSLDTTLKSKDIPKEMLIQLYTNLGNVYDSIGRINEAIVHYKEALKIYPNFPMANGNLGIAVFIYSKIIYDTWHGAILDNFSYKCFERCFEDSKNLFPLAKKEFKEYYKKLNIIYDKNFLDETLNFNDVIYNNIDENKYRNWCAINNLFLNPLNDIYINSFVWEDVLHLPNMILSINKKEWLKFNGLLNEIKQEYLSSRYIFYETTLFKKEEHFSDKNTYIIDTLDYSCYSLDSQKMRMVFRSLYSILDKVAFFLNEYFNVGIKETDVTFKTIWNTCKKSNGKIIYNYNISLKQETSLNTGLYGIYWIYKDFSEHKKTTTNPKISMISRIRNSLEHKYLKIVLDENILQVGKTTLDDKLALYISISEMNEIIVWLLKTIRSLIINLICCINIEEDKKKELLNKDNKVIPTIHLPLLDDEFKI